MSMVDELRRQEDAKRLDRLIAAIEALSAALQGSTATAAARLDAAEAALQKLSTRPSGA